MAEYVKFRVHAARMGVTMAFFALLTGIAEKARAANPTGARASSAAVIPGVGTVLKIDTALAKIENKLDKLAIKLTDNYLTAAKMHKTFVTIKKADSEFLLRKDSSQFLLRKDSSQFLTPDAATLQYLKISGTAANAQKLGNLAPNSFVQGNNTSVVSGALNGVTESSQQLLSLPGGIIVVDIAQVPGAGISVTFHNNTGTDLSAVGPNNQGGDQAIILSSSKATTVELLPAVQDARFQIFPGGTFQNVVSILIGLTPVPGSSQFEAVAQAFTGGV
jgi:hypothetical protein